MTYLADLDDTTPVNTDKLKGIVAEIQGIKSAFLDTFPNVARAVIPTDTMINYCAGVTSAIQTQINVIQNDIDALVNLANIYVIGGAWTGTSSSMQAPTGWTQSSHGSGSWIFKFPSEITAGRTLDNYFSVQLMSGDASNPEHEPYLQSRDRYGFTIATVKMGEVTGVTLQKWYGIVRVNP